MHIVQISASGSRLFPPQKSQINIFREWNSLYCHFDVHLTNIFKYQQNSLLQMQKKKRNNTIFHESSCILTMYHRNIKSNCVLSREWKMRKSHSKKIARTIANNFYFSIDSDDIKGKEEQQILTKISKHGFCILCGKFECKMFILNQCGNQKYVKIDIRSEIQLNLLKQCMPHQLLVKPRNAISPHFVAKKSIDNGFLIFCFSIHFSSFLCSSALLLSHPNVWCCLFVDLYLHTRFFL